MGNDTLKRALFNILESYRHLLDIILNNLNEGIVLMDTEYRILAINKAFTQIYGLESCPPDSLINKKCYEALRGRSLPCDDIPCPVEEVIKSKNVQIVEQTRMVNNVVKVINQLAIPILDENGQIKQIIKILEDLSDKKGLRTASALKSYVRSFIDSFPCGCMMVSPSGLIEFCNDECCSIIGYGKGQLIGDVLLSMFPEEVRSQVACLLSNVVRERVKVDFEAPLIKNSGDHLDVTICMTPIVINRDVKEIIVSLSPKGGYKDSVGPFTKYNITRGRTYLVVEDKPRVGRDVLKDLCNLGFHGIVFTRAPREEFANLEVNHYFLCSEKDRWGCIPPDPAELKRVIMGVKGSKNAILLESFYYLVDNNPFEKILSFLMEINEFLNFTKKGVMILSVGPHEIDAGGLSLLRKELTELQLRVSPPCVTQDLLEILRFIFNRNRAGELPYQSELCKRFNMSKVTMKRKLEVLRQYEWIKISRWGRMKVCEVTKEGRRLMEERPVLT